MRSLQNTAMRAFGCAISAGLLLVAGAGDAAAQAVQATDGRGATIRLAQPARRIITLTPHLTELGFAAGAGAQLAGVARFSNYPEAARRLPVVSDAGQFDTELLLALRPDLVLAWKNGTPAAVVARLESVGLPVFVAEFARLEDVARGIEAIATLAGTLPAGIRARDAYNAGLQALRARRHGGPPVRVFYEIWPQPLMTVNDTHIISDVLRLCGGVNIFGGLRPLTPEVSREALFAAGPEVALGGSSAETAAGFAARWAGLPPPLGTIPAHHIAPDLIQRPTPRLLEGARLVCAHLDAVRAARR
ncbi:MAG: helical backbone metal receptor [Burkholderiales bacterium]|nr:helical backbone metal receptor [Burkholderiales bacterium]